MRSPSLEHDAAHSIRSHLVRMEMSFVDQMRRIYTLAKRIAKVVLPPILAHCD